MELKKEEFDEWLKEVMNYVRLQIKKQSCVGI